MNVFLPVLPEGSLDLQEKEMFMYIAFGIAFALLVAGPFVGRWQANKWLKRNVPANLSTKSLLKAA
jgi:hypothetical protein